MSTVTLQLATRVGDVLVRAIDSSDNIGFEIDVVDSGVAWYQRDFEKLSHGARWLKALARTLGFDVFTGLASELEAAVGSGNYDLIPELLETITQLRAGAQLSASSADNKSTTVVARASGGG